jgi:hypothetical protein
LHTKNAYTRTDLKLWSETFIFSPVGGQATNSAAPPPIEKGIKKVQICIAT